MNLADMVGTQIYILAKWISPDLTTLKMVKLHGVEAGGIWIESDEINVLAETSYSIMQHSFPANIRDASRPKCCDSPELKVVLRELHHGQSVRFK